MNILFLSFYISCRDVIRKTWSNHIQLKQNSVKNLNDNVNIRNHFLEVFFLLAKPSHNNKTFETQQNKIIEESNKYNDIIQVDVEESYHNCFYKSTSSEKMYIFVSNNRLWHFVWITYILFVISSTFILHDYVHNMKWVQFFSGWTKIVTMQAGFIRLTMTLFSIHLFLRLFLQHHSLKNLPMPLWS